MYRNNFMNNLFAILVMSGQCILIIFFGIFTDYLHTTNPKDQKLPSQGGSQTVNENDGGMGFYYPLFQDVHVMMFIGFGFLLGYLGKYTFSSVGINFLLGAVVFQWSILNLGFWDRIWISGAKWEKIQLDIKLLINADYCVAAILISFGGVLGKFSPSEYIGMATLEVMFYAINLWICTRVYGAIDMGGSMFIHAFGAYFGLVVALIFSLRNPGSRTRTNNHSIYTSDTFSMIGTIFLWMFWPSFNGALAVGGQQHRVVINTILSLCVSCTVVFCYSHFLHGTKFEIVDIQNATLAGGVAVGCSSDLVIGPWGAMLIGFVAGTISAFGFRYLTPFLERKIGLHDTAGIHNLHGMPGILGGLGGIFSSLNASESVYGTNVGVVFPKRASSNATIAASYGIPPGEDRTAAGQAGFQAAALFTSVSMGILGGLVTAGFLLLPCFNRTREDKYFLDSEYWHVPQDYPGTERGGGGGNETTATPVATTVTPKVGGKKHRRSDKNKENGDKDSSIEIDTTQPTNAVNMSTVTMTIPDTLKEGDESL